MTPLVSELTRHDPDKAMPLVGGLTMTPALAAGVADHVSIEEIVGLMS